MLSDLFRVLMRAICQAKSKSFRRGRHRAAAGRTATAGKTGDDISRRRRRRPEEGNAGRREASGEVAALAARWRTGAAPRKGIDSDEGSLIGD